MLDGFKMTLEILAIIPARSGSKGIPGKNVRLIHGKPLLAYTIEHARQTPQITRIVVSTDGEEIARVANKYGAEVVHRPAAISGDGATSESALLHVLNYLRDSECYTPDLIVFLQATSPLRQPNDLQNAILRFQQVGADSLFAATPMHGFLWRLESDTAQSLNYDYQMRQRRQDAPQDVIENGSFYIFKPEILHRYHNRLGGKITFFLMRRIDSFEVDEPEDLELIEVLLKTP